MVYSLYLALLQPVHVEMDAICAWWQSVTGNLGRRKLVAVHGSPSLSMPEVVNSIFRGCK